MNQKSANLLPDDPKEAFILSLLAGGGAYSAARGVKSFINSLQPKKKDDSLEVMLPQHRIKTALSAETHQFLDPSLALIGGGAAGFLGASKLYELVKKHQQANELKDSEKEYVRALSHTQKSAEETPLVDMFCAGMANTFMDLGKTANFLADAGTAASSYVGSKVPAVKDFLSNPQFPDAVASPTNVAGDAATNAIDGNIWATIMGNGH